MHTPPSLPRSLRPQRGRRRQYGNAAPGDSSGRGARGGRGGRGGRFGGTPQRTPQRTPRKDRSRSDSQNQKKINEYYRSMESAEESIQVEPIRRTELLVVLKPPNYVAHWKYSNKKGFLKSDICPRVLLAVDPEAGGWTVPSGRTRPNEDWNLNLNAHALAALTKITGVELPRSPTYTHSLVQRSTGNNRKPVVIHSFAFVTRSRNEFERYAFNSQQTMNYTMGLISLPVFYEYDGTNRSIKGIPLYIRNNCFRSYLVHESLLLVMYHLNVITEKELLQICELSRIHIARKTMQLFSPSRMRN